MSGLLKNQVLVSRTPAAAGPAFFNMPPRGDPHVLVPLSYFVPFRNTGCVIAKSPDEQMTLARTYGSSPLKV